MRAEPGLATIGEELPHRLDERLVGDGQTVLARAVQDRRTFALQAPGELGGQPRLARARFTAHEHCAAVPTTCPLPRIAEASGFARPPHKSEVVVDRELGWKLDRSS